MSSSEYSASSSGEEEPASIRSTRTSSRVTPQKPPQRKASKRASYAPESSDDDEVLVVKRTRVSRQSQRRAAPNRKSESPVRNGVNDGASVSSDYTTKKGSAGPTASSKEPEKESPPKADTVEMPSEEEQIPKSPKKVFFADRNPGPSSLQVKMNGAARVDSAERGNDLPDKDLIPTLVHSLKLNTAMMGDLAAELRFLRETLVTQNQKK